LCYREIGYQGIEQADLEKENIRAQRMSQQFYFERIPGNRGEAEVLGRDRISGNRG
jgi:hypothetical protein